MRMRPVFPLCRFEEDDEEPYNLKWDSVVAEGILLVGEEDDEDTIRLAITQSLSSKLPLLGKDDFEFAKVRYKQIKCLELSPGTEYNYPVVKKLAGQGLLYLKVKQGFNFVYEEKSGGRPDIEISDDDKDDETFSKPTFGEKKESEMTQNSQAKQETEKESTQHATITMPATPATLCPNFSGIDIDVLVKEIQKQSLLDPVEILRFLQKEMVKGRALEISDSSETLEGETNHICVDRHNLITSTFSELESIEDYNITFEVDFIGEIAQGHGGPRKEWIRLINASIKEKYFDSGIKQFLSEEYYFVGIMVGIALMQNGQLPSYLPSEITNTLTDINSPNECIANLK